PTLDHARPRRGGDREEEPSPDSLATLSLARRPLPAGEVAAPRRRRGAGRSCTFSHGEKVASDASRMRASSSTSSSNARPCTAEAWRRQRRRALTRLARCPRALARRPLPAGEVAEQSRCGHAFSPRALCLAPRAFFLTPRGARR